MVNTYIKILDIFLRLSPLLLILFHIAPIFEIPLWYDELATWDIAKTLKIPKTNQPLFYYLTHFLMKLSDSESEYVLRVIPSICGSFIPLFGYKFTKRLYCQNVAIITWAILVSSPVILHLSREARVYSALVLLTITTAYFSNNLRKNGKTLDNYYFTLLKYTVSLQLLAHSHFMGLCTSLIILFFSYKLIKMKSHLLPFYLINITLVLPSLYKIITSGLKLYQTGFWPKHQHTADFLNNLINYFISGVNGVSNLSIVLLVIFVLLYSMWKMDNKKPILYIWMTIPISSIIIVSNLFFSLYINRYVLVSFFPFVILIALSFEEVLQKVFKELYSLGQFILITGIILLQLAYYSSNKEYIHFLNYHQDWRSITTQLETLNDSPNTILLHCLWRPSIINYYSLNKKGKFNKKKLCSKQDFYNWNLKDNNYKKIIVYNNLNTISADSIEVFKRKYAINALYRDDRLFLLRRIE